MSIMPISSIVSPVVDRLRSTVGYFAWKPSTNVARKLILLALDRITIGQLVIEENGTTVLCGTQNLAVGSPPYPASVLHVKSDAFWIRVALFADMVSCRPEVPSMTDWYRASLRATCSGNSIVWT